MAKCEPSGYKVSVIDVKKAAENAIAYGNKKRDDAMEIVIQRNIKRWFFKDRTYDEAKEKVLSEKSLFDDNWSMEGGWARSWGDTMSKAISVVRDDFVWLTKDEAENIAIFLSKDLK